MDSTSASEAGQIWNQATGRLERILIEEALRRCDGVKIKAADYLGINRNTLNKKFKELGLVSGNGQDEP